MKSKTTVSVILPCLNEEQTVAQCVAWAKEGLRKLGPHYRGEIIVVDNGSTDRSARLAKQAGAKVLVENTRGYGSAYKTGIAAAKGKYLVIGDSDGTYDFRQILKLIQKLKGGADIVLGSRLSSKLSPGTMPFSHRYIGNPILTALFNIFYNQRISDSQTGFRALTRKSAHALNLQSDGMEFASEMIVKAIYHQFAISEVPIRYLRRIGNSKLLPLSDAWRHIKFLILYTPTYAFIFPGLIFLLISPYVGVQLIMLGVFAKVYTEKQLKLPSGPLARLLLSLISVERLLIVGGIVFLFPQFRLLSVQLIFASFFYGLLKES